MTNMSRMPREEYPIGTKDQARLDGAESARFDFKLGVETQLDVDQVYEDDDVYGQGWVLGYRAEMKRLRGQ